MAMNQGRVKVLVLAAMCFDLFMANFNDTIVNVALSKFNSAWVPMCRDCSGLSTLTPCLQQV